jgi:hypothetical protein
MENGIITEDKYTRFKDAEWFNKDKPIVMVGGAGGIGRTRNFLYLC